MFLYISREIEKKNKQKFEESFCTKCFTYYILLYDKKNNNLFMK